MTTARTINATSFRRPFSDAATRRYNPAMKNPEYVPTDIEYARARPEDLRAVVELCMLVEEQHENYWPLRWQRKAGLREGYLGWLGRRLNEPRMLIQVARDRGEVVGMILVTIEDEVPIYTYSEYAFVQDMAVRASHQRRGIAQR